MRIRHRSKLWPRMNANERKSSACFRAIRLVSSEAGHRSQRRQGAIIRAGVFQHVLETVGRVVIHEYRSTIVLGANGGRLLLRIHYAVIKNSRQRLAEQWSQTLRDSAGGIIAST